jgi:hypothetical protein
MSEPSAPQPEEVGAARGYVLLHDADGYALWRVGDDVGGPIATFPDSEDGFDDAWSAFERASARRRSELPLTGLAALAVVSGVLWGAAAFMDAIVYAVAATAPGAEVSFYRYFVGLHGAARTVFTVTVPLYVIVWMQLRRSD